MRFTNEKLTGEHYRCKECGKYFLTREELYVHFSGEHERTEERFQEQVPHPKEAKENAFR